MVKRKILKKSDRRWPKTPKNLKNESLLKELVEKFKI